MTGAIKFIDSRAEDSNLQSTRTTLIAAQSAGATRGAASGRERTSTLRTCAANAGIAETQPPDPSEQDSSSSR